MEQIRAISAAEYEAELDRAWDTDRQNSCIDNRGWVAGVVANNADEVWAWYVEDCRDSARIVQVASGRATQRTAAVRSAAGAMSWYAF